MSTTAPSGTVERVRASDALAAVSGRGHAPATASSCTDQPLAGKPRQTRRS
jgi:hypothetical protein